MIYTLKLSPYVVLSVVPITDGHRQTCRWAYYPDIVDFRLSFFCRNLAPTDENSLSFPSIFSLKLFPVAGKRPEDWEPQLHTSRKTL